MKSQGTYISGSAAIEETDIVAREMERKWGVGRLRLLVGEELRDKFDRQRYLFNQAIYHGDLEAVRREARRMASAWKALDRAAEAVGRLALPVDVWEAPLPSGRVLALCRTDLDARVLAATRDGRDTVVWSLEEVVRVIGSTDELMKLAAVVKAQFAGAAVEAVRQKI